MADTAVAAFVQAGAVETPYVRAGHGESVILVGAVAPVEEDALFLHLATRYRVFAPIVVTSASCTSFDAWLRDFIDGLGLDQPRVLIQHTEPSILED
jgi:hypothetical protein